MKKDRNSMGSPYPVYPMYQPGMAGQPMMPQGGMMNQQMMMPQGGMINPPTGDNYNSINNQLANLEKRVSRLENIVGNNATYSESNFYMV